MKPEQAEIARLKREVIKLKAERDLLKKGRGLLREGEHVKLFFIAKHRGIWPAGWLRGALGVSRGGLSEEPYIRSSATCNRRTRRADWQNFRNHSRFTPHSAQCSVSLADE